MAASTAGAITSINIDVSPEKFMNIHRDQPTGPGASTSSGTTTNTPDEFSEEVENE